MKITFYYNKKSRKGLFQLIKKQQLKKCQWVEDLEEKTHPVWIAWIAWIAWIILAWIIWIAWIAWIAWMAWIAWIARISQQMKWPPTGNLDSHCHHHQPQPQPQRQHQQQQQQQHQIDQCKPWNKTNYLLSIWDPTRLLNLLPHYLNHLRLLLLQLLLLPTLWKCLTHNHPDLWLPFLNKE